MTRRRRLAGVLLASGLLLLIEGCYYMQAIRGHSDLMSRRRPVDEVIADEASPEELRKKLALVQEARDFAVDELMLPDNDSYRSYADLERDYVVWNVFAAPEFSLEPKTWCYPVAGCVAYRGYFKESSAREMGEKLEGQGYDVAIGGVAAYSTLGRFDDPLLNTMMRWSDVDLVATMFHELAHQKLYIKDDSGFNESFATAVAEIGVARWLDRTGELDRLAAYEDYRELRFAMQSLVAPARSALRQLYRSVPDPDALSDAELQTLRSRKRAILDRLSDDAAELIDADGRGLRNWLAAPLNNAKLVSTNLYQGRVEAFKAIYDACEQALPCFYQRTVALSELDSGARRRALDAAAD